MNEYRIYFVVISGGCEPLQTKKIKATTSEQAKRYLKNSKNEVIDIIKVELL